MPPKSKVNPKPTLSLTIRKESREKLDQLAKIENRSVSNLIEKMADDEWDRICEDDASTFLKNLASLLDMPSDTPDDRQQLRCWVLDRLANNKSKK